MATVAYLITSYVQPPQVLRLVRRLRSGSPRAVIAVHHDDRCAALDEAALRSLGVLRIVPPSRVEWGMGSQLEMHLRCYAWLLERAAFDWLVLLSGQDYPARPLADIERDLTAAPFDACLESRPVPAPGWSRAPLDEFASRYHFRYVAIPVGGPRLRALASAARPLLAMRQMPSGPVLGLRARAPFTADLRCRRGSDWVTLSRRAVEAVVAAARQRPGLLAHYRRTLIPTESFPHTVLEAAPGLRVHGDNRRFTRWRAGAARPEVLRLGDLDAILASGADFARKFDAGVDAAVLDALDARTGRR